MKFLAVEDEFLAADKVVAVVDPQDHLGPTVGNQQVRIAVAVAIGQANEPDLGKLHNGIKAIAPIVPQFDDPAFGRDQIEESIAVKVASLKVHVSNRVRKGCS